MVERWSPYEKIGTAKGVDLSLLNFSEACKNVNWDDPYSGLPPSEDVPEEFTLEEDIRLGRVVFKEGDYTALKVFVDRYGTFTTRKYDGEMFKKLLKNDLCEIKVKKYCISCKRKPSVTCCDAYSNENRSNGLVVMNVRLVVK